MKSCYKVVIVGFAHMHINDVAASFFANPGTKIVACADTIPARPELKNGPYTRKWNLNFCKENFHIERVYEDWLEMLDKEEPDLALITSENSMHPVITRECAKRGIDVIVEKPMASNLKDAVSMASDAKDGNTALITNWPTAWSPVYQRMKEIVDQGRIGRIIEFKCSMGHTGPLGMDAKHKGVSQIADAMSDSDKGATWWHSFSAGGGAMIDYCCYGSMLCTWMIGSPGISVMGMRGNFNSHYGDADDNAVMIVRFADCFSVIEGKWTTFGNADPYGPVIYGTDGAILLTPDHQGLMLALPGGKTEIIDCFKQPGVDLSSKYVSFKNELHPLPDLLLPELNLRAQAIMDAGLRSSNTRKEELIDNVSWIAGRL